MNRKKLFSLISTFAFINLLIAPSRVYASGDVSPISYISRQQVQDRAYNMAYNQWLYDVNLNGNVQSNTELPDQLKNKNNSYELGIPYNWGGFDGLDTTSSPNWSNFYDAINKGAMAGNIDTEGGYKNNTAGLDCSGFVQSSLNLRTWKQSTYTLGDYMTPISFDALKNMDILLWKTTHVVFFQSWVYDEYGNVLGANTIESTAGNYDGTGQKVKEYYRSLSDLTKNYTPERYNYVLNDYIENNSSEPSIYSPLFRQAIPKTSYQLTIKWEFNAPYENAYQTAYRIRIYNGEITKDSNISGKLVNIISENNSLNEKTIDLKNLPIGNYYFALETKNNRGYWSNPIISPFKVVTDSASVYNKFSNIYRLGGQNRFETSKIIAENSFPSKVNNVILASGYDFPDGLTGVTLSKEMNAPILLVSKSAGSSDSSKALQYINAALDKGGKIYILGGESVIDNSYITYLRDLGYSENNIIRIYGKDRNETSVKIAQNLNLPIGTPVVISNNNGFADSLSISSIAGFNKWPILLTSSNYLNESVESYLQAQKPSQIFVVGGTGVISDNIKNKIREITGLDDSKIVRLSGKDRYETSKIINDYFYNSVQNKIYAASGEDFPDSLSGSAAAAINKTPLLLIPNQATINSSKAINSLSNESKIDLNILGGQGVISDYQLSKIENMCLTSN